VVPKVCKTPIFERSECQNPKDIPKEGVDALPPEERTMDAVVKQNEYPHQESAGRKSEDKG
jgi:hypothetical protein